MISPAKIKCDYAIEEFFLNRIFNRIQKSSKTPLFIEENLSQKKIMRLNTEVPNRISQSQKPTKSWKNTYYEVMWSIRALLLWNSMQPNVQRHNQQYTPIIINVSVITTVSSLSTMWFMSLVPAWRMQARNSLPTSVCKRLQPRTCWTISICPKFVKYL